MFDILFFKKRGVPLGEAIYSDSYISSFSCPQNAQKKDKARVTSYNTVCIVNEFCN